MERWIAYAFISTAVDGFIPAIAKPGLAGLQPKARA